MDSAVLVALMSVPGLSGAGLVGLIDLIARLDPHSLGTLAARADLDDDLRGHLLRSASRYQTVALLAQWPADPALVRAAVAAHGSSADIIVYCGAHDWLDLAVELAGSADPGEAERVARRWSSTIDQVVPIELRAALINAALTERTPRPELHAMSKWERQAAMKRLRAELNAREQAAWRLLEPVPDAWVTFAGEGPHAAQIQDILLDNAAELPDEVLLSCLPAVTGEDLREAGEELFAGLRLTIAAGHVRKWPRLKEIAAVALRGMVAEVLDDGWTPAGRYGGPDWPQITAFAELGDDPTVLGRCLDVLRTTRPPGDLAFGRDGMASWHGERATAAGALAANPGIAADDFGKLLPILDEKAILSVLDRGDSRLHDACHERLARLRQEQADRQPTIIRVPSDDELARLDDPVAELRTHLRHLRGRADQRDATAIGLLVSRFTTAELLDPVPAHFVLDSAAQAGHVAAAIVRECGDDPARWAKAAQSLAESPRKNTTFRAWLDGLR